MKLNKQPYRNAFEQKDHSKAARAALISVFIYVPDYADLIFF